MTPPKSANGPVMMRPTGRSPLQCNPAGSRDKKGAGGDDGSGVVKKKKRMRGRGRERKERKRGKKDQRRGPSQSPKAKEEKRLSRLSQTLDHQQRNELVSVPPEPLTSGLLLCLSTTRQPIFGRFAQRNYYSICSVTFRWLSVLETKVPPPGPEERRIWKLSVGLGSISLQNNLGLRLSTSQMVDYQPPTATQGTLCIRSAVQPFGLPPSPPRGQDPLEWTKASPIVIVCARSRNLT
jgi:hypothetical protein